jgi:DtxR family Mn-dependent transcriptional regulator
VTQLNSVEKQVSSHAEDYLEAIYRLESKSGFARTMQLARELGVVAGSITNTIENLERKGLVIHEPYKGVKLTEDGRRIASNILRRHRLAERLLTDFLHVDWTEVHEPACKLEHAISPEIVRDLEKALGHPKRCPHGNPIPLKCGGILEDETIALSEVKVKTKVVIVKIINEKVDLLKKLTRLKLIPGKQIEIQNKSDTNGELIIRVENEDQIIDNDLAAIIYVKNTEWR